MSAKENLRAVHAWNKKHPVGTKVIATLKDGSPFATTTAGEAWLLGGRRAVIMVEGASFAFDLEAVQPMTKTEIAKSNQK